MKKKLLAVVLAIPILYLGWLGFESLGSRPYANTSLLAPAQNALEIEGVYHVHTKFSDGHASVDELAAQASREKLDFLILTDHGNPNFESLRSQGRKDGVLVLAGSELSVNRGHLVALGFRTPDRNFSQKAEDAVPEIQALGGFAVIAHPYSKVKWSWGDVSVYSGLEIINADTMFKNNVGRVLPYLPLLLFRSRLPLIRMLEHPEINLKKWDQRAATSAVYGYFSADAHLYYRAIFSLLHLHVLLDEPLADGFDAAAGQVYAALRKGRFFNAIEAAAGARGFRFKASAAGGAAFRMGDTIPAGAWTGAAEPVRFEARAPFSFVTEIHIVHDGRTIASTRDDVLTAEAQGPGVYRVEVFLKERSALAADIPWIISNPIFLRKD
jgi:hypothetical protein